MCALDLTCEEKIMTMTDFGQITLQVWIYTWWKNATAAAIHSAMNSRFITISDGKYKIVDLAVAGQKASGSICQSFLPLPKPSHCQSTLQHHYQSQHYQVEWPYAVWCLTWDGAPCTWPFSTHRADTVVVGGTLRLLPWFVIAARCNVCLKAPSWCPPTLEGVLARCKICSSWSTLSTR